MATIPTEGDDVLTGTKGADIIDGGGGDDIINSGAGDDHVSGGEGDDKINAGSGDDTLIGGAGNDTLNGGGGSDCFVFNFTIDLGGPTLTPIIFPGFDPGADGKLQQGEFSSQYSNWLKSAGTDGPDGNIEVDFLWNQNNAGDSLTYLEGAVVDGVVSSQVVYTGPTNTVTRYYEGTVYIETPGQLEITESDGYDVITSFQNAAHNVDKIQLNGLKDLSHEQLDYLFDITTIDTDGDGVHDATLLTWNGGSIQIGGTTQWGDDVLAFFGDAQVELC